MSESRHRLQFVPELSDPTHRYGWWAIKDLNLGPLPCEGSALTTELNARPTMKKRCLTEKRCPSKTSFVPEYTSQSDVPR